LPLGFGFSTFAAGFLVVFVFALFAVECASDEGSGEMVWCGMAEAPMLAVGGVPDVL